MSFKIPLVTQRLVNVLSSFKAFVFGDSVYGTYLDSFLDYILGSSTSETAVVSLDTLWLTALKTVGNFELLLNDHDGSSNGNLRPDASLVSSSKILLLKVESKAFLSDLETAMGELTSKFHHLAIKCFPLNCYSIPGVITCNERAHLYSINYLEGQFEARVVKTYNFTRIDQRAAFIIDMFKLCRGFYLKSLLLIHFI